MAGVRDRCLDDDEVQSLAFGSLSPETATALLAHVGSCDLCRALVAGLAREEPALSDDDARATLPRLGLRVLPRGATVDRYVVQDLIGHGGMGVVYAAQDPQLDRRVALKLVRTDHSRTPELRQRLVREAQMMARVSHVHVLTVYDAGIVDEHVFIAMELVDGSTLTEWLRGTSRAWPEVVAQFVRAARGLAAAHALGIVHRDFKPDNVLVGKDDRVRVSDFGLAEDDTRVATDGRLVGTPAYMAPEQMRGEGVDARTDQFSFCVALYEALFGQRPTSFGERSSSRRLALPDRVPRRVPAGVRRTLARGLSSSPSSRFPSMDALIAELERNTSGRRRGTVALGAVLLALLAAGVVIARRPRRPAESPATVRSVHRLTYTSGCEEYPSFVSHGGRVVFDGEVDGAQQLFLLDLAGGMPRQLTFGPGSSRAALVSPDGRHVVYERQLDGPRQLRLRNLDGPVEERTIGSGSTMGGSWLDDHRLAIIGTAGEILEIDADAVDAPWRPFYSDPGHHRFGLTSAFSDGTLGVLWWDPPNNLGIGLLSAAGMRVLVERLPYTDGALRVSPTDDALYYVHRAGAANELVRVARQGGPPLVVGGGIAPARGLAIARDGTRLVFSTCVSRAQLQRIGGTKSAALFHPQPWSDTAPAPIDDHRVLFASDRSGHDQLYIADSATTGEPKALTGLDVEEGAPSIDGRWFVYSARNPGGVWLAPLDGSAPARRLTEDAHDESPGFSRDGSTIFFLRGDAIFALARDGGEPRLIARPASGPVPSPVDDRVYFLQRQSAQARPRIMMVSGRGTTNPVVVSVLPPGTYWSLTIAPDGRTLALVNEGFEVLEVPLDGRGPPRVRTRLSRWISALHYSFDGRELLASVEALDGDLWLAEGQFR